jgi:hypothetical protein
MTLKQVESTWICQLNKPENRAMLEGYKQRRLKTGTELANYWRDIIAALIDTPAWDVSGVNKMLTELAAGVRATLTHAKRGKISAYAHAGQLLYKIDSLGNNEVAYDKYYQREYNCPPVLTDDELRALATMN